MTQTFDQFWSGVALGLAACSVFILVMVVMALTAPRRRGPDL